MEHYCGLFGTFRVGKLLPFFHSLDTMFSITKQVDNVLMLFQSLCSCNVTTTRLQQQQYKDAPFPR